MIFRMCTLAVYVQQFPDFPLVLAANRDEFFARPASAPVVLASTPRIVGGRDLQAGGTWLAISEHAVAAALLNRRTSEPPIDGKRSRGTLVVDALAARSADDAAHLLAHVDARAYNAFTMLVAGARTAVVVQNRVDGMHLTPLDPGVHVLGNLDVIDPVSPKVSRAHERFARAGDAFRADHDGTAFRDALRAILADHSIAADPRLPDALGALCVHSDTFGTRCSSLVFLDALGHWHHWFADGPPCRAAYEPALTP
jgi:uncharacterized protein with NRDE domain